MDEVLQALLQIGCFQDDLAFRGPGKQCTRYQIRQPIRVIEFRQVLDYLLD